MKRLLIILFLFTSCAKSQVGTLRIKRLAHDKPKLPSSIVYFGDSFTANTGVSYPWHVGTDYPSIWWAQYAVGSAMVCTNTYAPVPGNHNLIDIYQDILDSVVLSGDYRNTIFSFAHGFNDNAVNATWKATYQAIIQAFIDAGIPRRRIIMIATPAHSTQAAARAQTRAYILQIATELRVQFYDCYQRFLDTGINDTYYTSGDGYVHPDNDGQLVWTAGFETFLIR